MGFPGSAFSRHNSVNYEDLFHEQNLGDMVSRGDIGGVACDDPQQTLQNFSTQQRPYGETIQGGNNNNNSRKNSAHQRRNINVVLSSSVNVHPSKLGVPNLNMIPPKSKMVQQASNQSLNNYMS